MAERAVAGVRACWRFGDPAALLFPVVHIVRNLAWVAAMGVWSFRRATGHAASAADSMTPRAGGVRTFIPAPIRTVGIIPAHNEMGSLARVVTEIRENCPDLDLLVVDDGSTDASASVLAASRRAVPADAGASRRGQRDARRPAICRTGLATIRRFAWMATASMAARTSNGCSDHCATGVADVSLGSRFLHDGSGHAAPPRVTRLAQSALGLCLSALTRRRVTDPTSGFYALGPRAMRLLSEHHPTGYAEPELRLLLCRNELVVVEVPVAPRPRLAGRTSLTAGRLAGAGARVLLAMLIVPLRPGVGPPPGVSDVVIDRIQVIAIVLSAVFLLAVLELVRRRKLVEEYSFLWIARRHADAGDFHLARAAALRRARAGRARSAKRSIDCTYRRRGAVTARHLGHPLAPAPPDRAADRGRLHPQRRSPRPAQGKRAARLTAATSALSRRADGADRGGGLSKDDAGETVASVRRSLRPVAHRASASEASRMALALRSLARFRLTRRALRFDRLPCPHADRFRTSSAPCRSAVNRRPRGAAAPRRSSRPRTPPRRRENCVAPCARGVMGR